MSIRVLCAAAAVAVGVGQAEAAVLESGFYEVNIALTDTYWDCYRCADHLDPKPKPDTLEPFYGLNLGDTVQGTFSFLVENGVLYFELAHAGATIRGDGTHYITDDNKYLSLYDYTYLEFDIVDGLFQGIFTDYDFGGEWRQVGRLDFVEIPPMAPVPLPAAAALLPLGIGALAMMRRRRRPA